MAGIGRLRKFLVVLENADPTTPAPIAIVQVGLVVPNSAENPALRVRWGWLDCHETVSGEIQSFRGPSRFESGKLPLRVGATCRYVAGALLF